MERWYEGMKVYISQTKINVGGESSQDADRTVRWSCSVCGKGWVVTRYGAVQ